MELLKVCIPVLVAFIGIIPTIISNRKKTQESLNAFKEEIKKDNAETHKEVQGIKASLEAHIEEDKANDADRRKRDMVQVRARILRFEADCLNKYVPYPTEGMFMQNSDDENEYRTFLESDLAKDFHNGMCEDAMEYIDDMFRYCKDNNLFGKPKGGRSAAKTKTD